MSLNVLYFAWVREAIGLDGEMVSPPPEVVTVGGLVAWLAGRSEGHARAFADHARLRAAVDQRFVSLDASLDGVGEVALFPPVTGG